MNQARIRDERECKHLETEQVQLYKLHYQKLYDWENNFNIKDYILRKNVKEINQTIQVLDSIEDHLLAEDIVTYRILALGFEIPSAGGDSNAYISPEVKAKVDLQKFLLYPISSYHQQNKHENQQQMKHFLNMFKFHFELEKFSLYVLSKKETIFEFFLCNFEMNFQYLLMEQLMAFEMNIFRFGIQDPRNGPKNAFSRILDRNPEGSNITSLSITFGKEDSSVVLQVQDFSFLFIPEPFILAYREFYPIFEEEEEEHGINYRYILMEEEEEAQTRMLTSKTITNTPLANNSTSAYSPLIFRGLHFNVNIIISGCELCLVSDPSTLNSHILAITSNADFKIKSGPSHETMVLQLSEVALQPCKVQLETDSLRLDMLGYGTILELEGDDVDFELNYSLDLTPAMGSFLEFEKYAHTGKNLSISSALSSTNFIVAAKDGAMQLPDNFLDKGFDATREIKIGVSDISVDFSKEDVALFFGILNRLNELLIEDEVIVKERIAKTKRIEQARKVAERNYFQEKLKIAFNSLDTDGSGTLDEAETINLLRSVMSVNLLTKDELDESVAAFFEIVDRDGSGDISVSEFLKAMNKEDIKYEALHKGWTDLVAHEYVNPHVPRRLDNDNEDLRIFWEIYTTQTGASESSLQGQSPLVVQKKMIRAFKNFEYSRQTWNELVRPSLTLPFERSPWLVARSMVIERPLIFSISSHRNNPVSKLFGDPIFLKNLLKTICSRLYFRSFTYTFIPLGIQEKVLRAFQAFDSVQKVWQRLLYPFHHVAFDRTSYRQKLLSYVDYLTESWNHVLRPMLLVAFAKPTWLKGIRQKSLLASNTFDKLTSYATNQQIEDGIHSKPITVKTGVTTSFGGTFIRIVDKLLPFGIPSIEFSLEEITFDAIYSGLEGLPDDEFDLDNRKGVGSAHFKFNVNGQYYNSRIRRTEPFLEPYSGVLTISKEKSIAVRFRSEAYCHLDITSTFLDSINSNFINISSTEHNKEVKKENIDNLGGIFWLKNDSGQKLDYWLVTQKTSHRTSLEFKSPIKTVSADEFDACIDQENDDVIQLHHRQNAMGKKMRKAFRDADIDSSGTLELEELRMVLREVAKQTTLTEEEVEDSISAIVKSADRDNSGHISYDEFKVAMDKFRDTSKRTLSLKIHGYEPIDNIPIDLVGNTLVFELTPEFDHPDLESTSCEEIYNLGMMLLSKQNPSPFEISQAAYLLARVSKIDDIIDVEASYLDMCRKHFIPRFIGVELGMDKKLGMQIRVNSALEIQNGTENTTELKLLHAYGSASNLNPNVGYFSIAPRQSIHVPLDLVNQGKFAIRQVGEVEWSDGLEITVSEEFKSRIHVKHSKSYRQRIPDGEKKIFTSTQTIDGHPLSIIEVGTAGLWSKWQLSIQPQFVIENTLPCLIEYEIAQATDCPGVEYTTNKVTAEHAVDWFPHVSEVNFRKGKIASGSFAQVTGLQLDKVAFVKCRLPCSSGESVWSKPTKVKFYSKKFNGKVSTISLPQVSFSFHHVGRKNEPLRIVAFAPYWIQNKSGLDLTYWIVKGKACSIEEHNKYFGNDSNIPYFIGIGDDKTKLSVKPQGICENDIWNDASKYIFSFKHIGWSNQISANSVGSGIEVKEAIPLKGSGFVISCEISVVPDQFNRTKLITFYPRYVVKNRLPSAIHLTPINIDKHGDGFLSLKKDPPLTVLRKSESLLLYRFEGNSKGPPALQMRYLDVNDLGEEKTCQWMHNIPLSENNSFDLWTNGMEGPLIKVNVQEVGPTTFADLTDISTIPAMKIENRSTICTISYIQVGIQGDVETLSPQTWRSFALQNQFKGVKQLLVYIGSLEPIKLDILQVRRFGQVTPNNSDIIMFSEVYLDGSTRVLSFSDTNRSNNDRMKISSLNFLKNLSLNVGFHGFGMTIVDTQPKEVMNITAEEIRLISEKNSRMITCTILHFQIDDMTPGSLYPAVLVPYNCGFNSNQATNWKSGDKNKPFIKINIESSLGEGITIFNDCNIDMGSVKMKVNLDYILSVVSLMLRYVEEEDPKASLAAGIKQKDKILSHKLQVPDVLGKGALLYLEKWLIKSFGLHMIFHSNPNDSSESDIGNTWGRSLGGITHVTPDFKFKKIGWENEFFFLDELIYDIIMKLERDLLRQLYKLASVEILGDPIGLANDISSGFKLAAKQAKEEMKGESDKKGQAAATLVKTTVGKPMGAIGKSANAIGDAIKKVTFFEDQEERKAPKNVGVGIVQGVEVFGKSVAHGVKGVVTKPYQGAVKHGAKGFIKGMGKGGLGLVASPLIGALGTVEKLTMSVDNATHSRDPKYYEGTRRPARDLSGTALKSLLESNIMTEMEVHVLEANGLPSSSNAKLFISLLEFIDNGMEESVSDSFRTSTQYRTIHPKWNESRLFDIKSTEMKVRIELYHKTYQKILLGRLELTIRQIYETFDLVDSEIFGKSKVQEAILSKKRVKGSILEKCLAEDPTLELDDKDGEKSAITKESIQLVPAKIHELNFDDSPIKLLISIRYVNDMRR